MTSNRFAAKAKKTKPPAVCKASGPCAPGPFPQGSCVDPFPPNAILALDFDIVTIVGRGIFGVQFPLTELPTNDWYGETTIDVDWELATFPTKVIALVHWNPLTGCSWGILTDVALFGNLVISEGQSTGFYSGGYPLLLNGHDFIITPEIDPNFESFFLHT